MIIRQTTTIVFEYPQDYLQEQEWCKTKDDRWIHKSTDTLCAVYEYQISYSVGASADRMTEPQTTDYCDVCNHIGCDNCVADGSDPYGMPSHYESKNEPQTERREP